MVVTSAPATLPTGVMHERVGRPPTCTVQAPHMPIPQPNLVPVKPIVSRITQRSGVSSSTSTDAGRPLIWNVVINKRLPTVFSARSADLVPHCGDLLVEVSPGRQVCAGTAQVGGNPGDIGVGEGV